MYTFGAGNHSLKPLNSPSFASLLPSSIYVLLVYKVLRASKSRKKDEIIHLHAKYDAIHAYCMCLFIYVCVLFCYLIFHSTFFLFFWYSPIDCCARLSQYTLFAPYLVPVISSICYFCRCCSCSFCCASVRLKRLNDVPKWHLKTILCMCVCVCFLCNQRHRIWSSGLLFVVCGENCALHFNPHVKMLLFVLLLNTEILLYMR